jgi:hypothetical protein
MLSALKPPPLPPRSAGRTFVIAYWSMAIIGMLTLVLLAQPAFVDSLTMYTTGGGAVVGVVLGLVLVGIGLGILPIAFAQVVYWWPADKHGKVLPLFGVTLFMGFVAGAVCSKWWVDTLGFVAAVSICLVLNLLALGLYVCGGGGVSDMISRV